MCVHVCVCVCLYVCVCLCVWGGVSVCMGSMVVMLRMGGCIGSWCEGMGRYRAWIEVEGGVGGVQDGRAALPTPKYDFNSNLNHLHCWFVSPGKEHRPRSHRRRHLKERRQGGSPAVHYPCTGAVPLLQQHSIHSEHTTSKDFIYIQSQGQYPPPPPSLPAFRSLTYYLMQPPLPTQLPPQHTRTHTRAHTHAHTHARTHTRAHTRAHTLTHLPAASYPCSPGHGGSTEGRRLQGPIPPRLPTPHPPLLGSECTQPAPPTCMHRCIYRVVYVH